jgi:hypothetical protein
MKTLKTCLSVAALAFTLSACYAPGPNRVAVGVGVDGGYYDGYYDGFYGPFYDGYWGGDGFFYYADRDRGWHRDDDRHFRRDAAHGFQHIHGSGVHREH